MSTTKTCGYKAKVWKASDPPAVKVECLA